LLRSVAFIDSGYQQCLDNLIFHAFAVQQRHLRPCNVSKGCTPFRIVAEMNCRGQSTHKTRLCFLNLDLLTRNKWNDVR